ncbi:MAG: glycine betaine ABC transporter substrate-binding protein [Planctomycetota bacterium]
MMLMASPPTPSPGAAVVFWHWLTALCTLAWDRRAELLFRTGEHVVLTGGATLAAIAIGVPLGVLAARKRWARGPVSGSVGILQTVPSLAMLAILLALLHQIGYLPAVIALTLYALLPIMRNTLTGLEGLPQPVLEAAEGLGMTPAQKLFKVELPMALPVIIAGIRTAAVVGVGIGTLMAFIGAGGLGEFINRGLSLNNSNLILLGAIPAAILALLVDGSIAAFQWGLTFRQHPRRPWAERVGPILQPLALAAPVLILACGSAGFLFPPGDGAGPSTAPSTAAAADSGASHPTDGVFRIGSKNFTEQLILGEMMAQMIEAHTHLKVVRNLDMAGTMLCHQALVSGAIDCYPEYTGTALTAILKQPVVADPDKAYAIVAKAYKKQFRCEWLDPFGFNNTYALTVRGAEARDRRLTKISDLLALNGQLRAGFTAEFSERPDGLPGLRKAYGLGFKSVVDLDPSIMYQAVAQKQVDIICAFATDGRIAAFHLHPLVDDKGYFPPYFCAPVVRMEALRQHPEIRTALDPLAGLLTDEVMQHLNFEVDVQKRSPQAVAHEFLVARKLLAR